MRMLVGLVLISAFALTHSQKLLNVGLDQWEMFKINHDKKYESVEEEEMRKSAFMKNLEIVDQHNDKYYKNEVSYRIGINKFSDLTPEEVSAKLTGCFKISQNSTSKKTYFYEGTSSDLPEAIDWRTQGAVTEVKDQGRHCGSCWAFSTTGSLEGMQFLKTKKLVSLSEQNLVDCDKKDSGCSGGYEDTAFNYIIQNGGIDTEESYPYEGRDGDCKYNPKTIGASVKDLVKISSGDEEQLKAAVAKKGPISIAMAALDDIFAYKDGVYSNPNCSSIYKDLNHALLLVGYGTTDEGEDYWLIKNSWGPEWGMKGYFMLARNKNNMCGVATDAMYPVVA